MIDASGALFPFIYPGGLKPFTPHGGNPDVLRQSGGALWSPPAIIIQGMEIPKSTLKFS